ncbi:zinc finger protein 665-like [Lineus longissimus]|uniref:zinc finger protein 665-like n=1 Tax=Lineus longissimus TaxID=88925 RepID=UPI002B4D68AC
MADICDIKDKPNGDKDLPPPPPSRPQTDVCDKDLPPDWRYARDAAGDVYYYNTITKKTQWHPPTWPGSGKVSPVDNMDKVKEKDVAGSASATESPTVDESSPEPGILSVQVLSVGSVVCTLGEKHLTDDPVPMELILNELVSSKALTSGGVPLMESGHGESPVQDSEKNQPKCTSDELPVPKDCEVPFQGGNHDGSEVSFQEDNSELSFRGDDSKVPSQEDNESSSNEKPRVSSQEYRGGTFNCAGCGEVFSSESEVNGHVCRPKKKTEGLFQCEICHKIYRWKKDLKLHEASALKEGRLVCSVCNQAFCTRRDLTRHERIHADKMKPGDHKCENCGKVYRWKKDLVIHMTTARSQDPVACSVCDKPFCTKNDLAKHFRGHVLPEKLAASASTSITAPLKIRRITPRPVMITRAGSASSAAVAMTPAMLTSAGHVEGPAQESGEEDAMEVTLNCSQCDKVFSSDSELTAHVRSRHKKKTEGPNQCQTCGKIYRWKKDLMIHISNSEAPLKCSFCDKSFCMKVDLDRHLPRQHPEVTPFKCTTCDKAFSRRYALNNHVRTGCGKNKTFKCSECGKAFLSQRLLDVHAYRHRGEKPYKCSFCEKVFGTRAHVNMHERIHTGEKPYQCATCGKCFTSNGELKLHTRVHTGEKPYVCTYCPKAFSGNSRLHLHIRSIHTHEKNYLCSFCAKAFVSSAQMKKHMRVHTGEKPYKCSHCDKWFSQQSARKTHEYIHTGERPFVCPRCKKSWTQKGMLTSHLRTCNSTFEKDTCKKVFSPLLSTFQDDEHTV